MLTSLKVNCSEAVVFVLCMDTLAAEVLASLKMDCVICVALSQVENAQALDVKKGRNTAEYCWTMSSFFTYWVMENHPEVDVITYLDADLMFFSAVQPIGTAAVSFNASHKKSLNSTRPSAYPILLP